MNVHRPALVATAVALIVTGTLSTPAAPGRAEMTSGPAQDRLEAVLGQVPDGTFLGYVASTGRGDDTVAVDFVAVREGVAVNDRPGAVVVHAGLLAQADILTTRPQPFHLVIRDDEIVELTSADDVLPRPPGERGMPPP